MATDELADGKSEMISLDDGTYLSVCTNKEISENSEKTKIKLSHHSEMGYSSLCLTNQEVERLVSSLSKAADEFSCK